MATKPKIRRKNSQLQARSGQLVESFPPAQKPAPTEVPEIVERYMSLVGRVIHSFEQQEKFGSKEANAVASIGRAVALLQAIDTAKASLGAGEKPIDQMTTDEIRGRLGAGTSLKEQIAETIDADFEDTKDDE